MMKHTIPQVSRYHLKKENAPPMRFALIADLHDRDGAEALRIIREEKPDFICLPGDIMESDRGSLREQLRDDYRLYRSMKKRSRFHLIERMLQHCVSRVMEIPARKHTKQGLAFLCECAQIAPTFYSPGNHDRQLCGGEKAYLEKAGVHCLLSEDFLYTLPGGETLRIGGMTNQLDEAFLKAFEAHDEFCVLLCHHPEYYPDCIRETHIPLILSGHAHGGQIRIGGRALYAPTQGFLPAYTKGVYDERLIVTAGLLQSALPRWGNPPEIVIVEVMPCTN